MTLLSPSLAMLEAPLADALQLMDDLGCESVHIDACHNLTLPNFFELEGVRTAQIRKYRAMATVHVFQSMIGRRFLTFSGQQTSPFCTSPREPPNRLSMRS
mgnify:CR=1 FL=1